MSDEVIKWRQEFHKYPEVEFDLSRTSVKVAQLLKSFGLEVFENIGICGVVGKLQRGNSSKSIGLRADMDALLISEKNTFSYASQNSGKMHACGHDGHMAMLLGAAKELSQSSNIDGTLYFIFQPDEEHGTGAQKMIDDGLFKKFPMDAVYGLHNMPGIPAGHFAIKSGAIMASEDSFLIKVLGRGGHASQPHRCIDPIVISSQIVLALQSIVSRNIDPFDTAVVSVTNIETDGTTNVIPNQVVISGDCRTFKEEVQEEIAKRMEELVASITKSYNATYEFSYKKLFYPTVNSAQETQNAIRAAKKASNHVNEKCHPMTTSEDFSSMLRKKPGAYILLGNGIDSHGGCLLHNPHYDFNDEIISTGIKYWVTLAQQELKKVP